MAGPCCRRFVEEDPPPPMCQESMRVKLYPVSGHVDIPRVVFLFFEGDPSKSGVYGSIMTVLFFFGVIGPMGLGGMRTRMNMMSAMYVSMDSLFVSALRAIE